MYLTKADEGWAWLILVVSFLDHCITGFCMYAVGLFHITILERFYESVTLTSWLSSIFLCLLSLSGPGASLLIDKWNCRVTMVVGSIMLTTGLVVTAYFNSILMVLVFFSLIGGFGLGLISNTGYIVLAFNFERKRNIATGISVSGCGIGPFVLAPIYQTIYHEYGYNGFFLLLAGLTLQACAFGAVLRPSSLEISAKLSRMNRKESRCACDFTVVKDKALLSVGFAALFFNIGIFLIYLHFPKYAIDNGSSEVEVSWLLSIAGACSCIGMASNSETVSEDIIFFASYVLIGVTTLCLPLLISKHSVKVIYMIILGTYNGACYVVLNSIVLKLVGPNHVAQGTGYVMAFIGIGTLVGPPLGGFIVDNGGSYDMSFSIAGVSLILGGSIELLNVLFKKERYEKPTTKDILISVSSISQQDIVITETASEQECDCRVYNSEQETAAFKKNYST